MSDQNTSDCNNPGCPPPASNPYQVAPPFPPNPSPNQPAGLPLHSCMGLNSCKGSDRFGVNGTGNPFGPNECAGQGFCSTTADHQCHVTNQCQNQGGCGLYGTAEELNYPGLNGCKSLGSCATPINAERFSTNGPNQKKSVWLRAREVFHEKLWPGLHEKNPALPEQLPPVGGDAFVQKYGDVFQNGPAYQWISDNNTARGNMTSCGASGMSGAGGCG